MESKLICRSNEKSRKRTPPRTQNIDPEWREMSSIKNMVRQASMRSSKDFGSTEFEDLPAVFGLGQSSRALIDQQAKLQNSAWKVYARGASRIVCLSLVDTKALPEEANKKGKKGARPRKCCLELRAGDLAVKTKKFQGPNVVFEEAGFKPSDRMMVIPLRDSDTDVILSVVGNRSNQQLAAATLGQGVIEKAQGGAISITLEPSDGAPAGEEASVTVHAVVLRRAAEAPAQSVASESTGGDETSVPAVGGSEAASGEKDAEPLADATATTAAADDSTDADGPTNNDDDAGAAAVPLRVVDEAEEPNETGAADPSDVADVEAEVEPEVEAEVGGADVEVDAAAARTLSVPSSAEATEVEGEDESAVEVQAAAAAAADTTVDVEVEAAAADTTVEVEAAAAAAVESDAADAAEVVEGTAAVEDVEEEVVQEEKSVEPEVEAVQKTEPSAGPPALGYGDVSLLLPDLEAPDVVERPFWKSLFCGC